MNAKRLTLIIVVLLLVLLTGCANTEELSAEYEALCVENEALRVENEALNVENVALRVENEKMGVEDTHQGESLVKNDALGVENDWRSLHTRPGGKWKTNVEIVFEPDDKCSMTIHQNPWSGGLAYTILVKDDTYDDYLVAIDSLDEGYTIEDLKAHKPASVGPSFANLISYHAVDPGSTSFSANVLKLEEGDYYVTCQVQGAGVHKNIAVLGPIHVGLP